MTPDPSAVVPPEWQKYLSPDTLTTWGVAAAKALIVFVIGWIVAGWMKRLTQGALERAKVDVALAGFLSNIVRYTVIFATIIAAAGALGINTTSLTAIFASAGLAVGLALQGSLSNFASGVMILFFRPFTIGDVITVNGTTAKVAEIGLFATIMMQPDGTKVIVPNGGVTGSTILNHTELNKRRASVGIGVDYGVDLDEVRAALTRAANNVPEILDGPDGKEFAVAFVEFGGSSLDWKVHCYSTAENFLAMQEKLRVNIYNELNAAGIGIPFPQLDVHFDSPPPTA